jgi:hypothetical protein
VSLLHQPRGATLNGVRPSEFRCPRRRMIWNDLIWLDGHVPFLRAFRGFKCVCWACASERLR